jgi:hypothetical protein
MLALYHKGSFWYLGMDFYQTLNMANKFVEHAYRPFLTYAYGIRRYELENVLADKPHTPLRLAKT